MAVNADIVCAILRRPEHIACPRAERRIAGAEMPVQTAVSKRKLSAGWKAAVSLQKAAKYAPNGWISWSATAFWAACIGFSVIDINRDLRNGILMVPFWAAFSFWLRLRWLADQPAARRPLERLNRAMLASTMGGFRQSDATNPRWNCRAGAFFQPNGGWAERARNHRKFGKWLGASFQLTGWRCSFAIGWAVQLVRRTRDCISKIATTLHFPEMTARSAIRNPFRRLSGCRNAPFSHPKPGRIYDQNPLGIRLKSLRHEHRREDGLVMPMTVKMSCSGCFFWTAARSAFYSKRQIHLRQRWPARRRSRWKRLRMWGDLREQNAWNASWNCPRSSAQAAARQNAATQRIFDRRRVRIRSRKLAAINFDFFISRTEKSALLLPMWADTVHPHRFTWRNKGMMLHSPNASLAAPNCWWS